MRAEGVHDLCISSFAERALWASRHRVGGLPFTGVPAVGALSFHDRYSTNSARFLEPRARSTESASG